MIETVELTGFAKRNGWIMIDQSDEDDENLGDRYMRYLTPQGRVVLVKLREDGSIQRIIA